MTRRSQYSRDFQDRRHARGLCTQCGAPHVNKSNRTKVLARLCVGCTNRAVERDRRRRAAR